LKWSVLILGILNHFLIQVAKYVFCSFLKTSGKYGSAFMLFLAILNNASGSQVAAEANPCGLWLLTTALAGQWRAAASHNPLCFF